MKNIIFYLNLLVLILISNIVYYDLYKSIEVLNEYVVINIMMLLVLIAITTYYVIDLYKKNKYIKLSFLIFFQFSFYLYIIYYVNGIPKIQEKEIIKISELENFIVTTKDYSSWEETCLLESKYQYKLPFFNPKIKNLTKETDLVDSYMYFVNEESKGDVGSIRYGNLHHNKLFYNKTNNNLLKDNLKTIINSQKHTKTIDFDSLLDLEQTYKVMYSDKMFIPIKDGYAIKIFMQHFFLKNINPEFKNKISYQKINDDLILFEIENENKLKKYKLYLETNIELETGNLNIIKTIIKSTVERQCTIETMNDLMLKTIKDDDIGKYAFYFMQKLPQSISKKEKMKVELIKF